MLQNGFYCSKHNHGMSWVYVGFDLVLCRNHVIGGNDLSTNDLKRVLYNIDLYCSISFLG